MIENKKPEQKVMQRGGWFLAFSFFLPLFKTRKMLVDSKVKYRNA